MLHSLSLFTPFAASQTMLWFLCHGPRVPREAVRHWLLGPSLNSSHSSIAKIYLQVSYDYVLPPSSCLWPCVFYGRCDKRQSLSVYKGTAEQGQSSRYLKAKKDYKTCIEQASRMEHSNGRLYPAIHINRTHVWHHLPPDNRPLPSM